MSLKTNMIIKKYDLNRNTSVTVKSQLVKGSVDLYQNKIIIEHTTADKTPLTFPTVPALEEYVRGIDMEEDQRELQFGSNEE